MKNRRIAVVGGGLAGAEYARTNDLCAGFDAPILGVSVDLLRRLVCGSRHRGLVFFCGLLGL